MQECQRHCECPLWIENGYRPGQAWEHVLTGDTRLALTIRLEGLHRQYRSPSRKIVDTGQVSWRVIIPR